MPTRAPLQRHAANPLTLRPAPYSLNPKPSTLNPQPSTLNPQHARAAPIEEDKEIAESEELIAESQASSQALGEEDAPRPGGRTPAVQASSAVQASPFFFFPRPARVTFPSLLYYSQA